MTAITPKDLLEELHKAADVADGAATAMTEDDVRAPSELPDWTRGHVLAHISGISHAMARQLEYAARGETVELYDGGLEGRTQAIDMAAGNTLEEHRAALDAALRRVLVAFGELDDAGWQRPIAYRGGVVFDGGLALWRELTIHAADLGMGRGPETWGVPFCEHLLDFLAARVPEDQRFVLQPLGLPQVTIGSGPSSTVIGGMLTDLAAWLAGRTPRLGSLRAAAAGDGVDLPELLPWPSGVPAAKS